MRYLFLILLTYSSALFAQAVEVQDDAVNPPEAVGKERAAKYFKERKQRPAQVRRAPAQQGGTPRFLAVHVGSFFTSQSYQWGHGSQDNVGKLNAGVTYRLGEWVNSMDMNLRVEYTNFELDQGSARKLSFGTTITFPDANSRFPLYFGAGLGAGFFLKQVSDESAIALDYSLFAGARFLDVIESVGFMVETGLKNHLHLLSDGQYNGVFLNIGAVFAF